MTFAGGSAATGTLSVTGPRQADAARTKRITAGVFMTLYFSLSNVRLTRGPSGAALARQGP